MEKELLSIGDMARINHTTITALRLYDEMGILRPAYVNPENNYRYYDIKQNARLDLISYMKELGMNLKEIKELLDKKDLNLIEAILLKKKDQLKEELSLLEVKKDAVNRVIYSLERYRKSPPDGIITTEYIDKRRIYAMSTTTNFYDYDIEVYEEILKELKDELIARHLPKVYYTNAGTIMSQQDFLNLHFSSHEIFVFVDDHFPLKEEIRVLDDGMYACIYLDSFEKEKDYAKQLLAYCQAHHLTIVGDYICEVLTEFNFFEHDQRSMFLRLEVPISFHE